MATAISMPIPEPDIRPALVGAAPTQAGSAFESTNRVRVSFTLYRVRLLDPDNKYASVKLLLDAIRHAGAIEDDNEKVIELSVTQVKVKTYVAEGTKVSIKYKHE
jgi:Holliday junction resolvase RusA-like endonuclease